MGNLDIQLSRWWLNRVTYLHDNHDAERYNTYASPSSPFAPIALSNKR